MARNVLHLGLGQVGTTVLTVLLNATLARTLGPADFGLLYLVTTIATFAYVVVDWGHGGLIIRETARDPRRSGELLGTAMALRTVCALAACAVAVASTWLLGYDMRTCVLTGALIMGWLPLYLGLSFGWVFRGRERMDRDALLNLVAKGATLLGSIVCFALGARLLGLVLTWSLAGWLTLAIGILMYRRLDLPAMAANLSTARELLRDGAPLLAITLVVGVEPYVNANILYKMASPTVVACYGAASNIFGTLIAPATILGSTTYPRLSSARDPAEFKRAFGISLRLLSLLAFLGGIGTYLFADVPVALIYSLEKFAPAVDSLRAFAPVLVLMYVDIFLASAIVAAGKAVRLAGIKAASVAFTSGLVFVLVPLYQARYANGGLGAIHAMAIGELVMVVAEAILMGEFLDRRTLGDLLRGLIAAAATFMVVREWPALTPFLAIPLCVSVFAAISLLVGAVNRSDVAMLKR